MTVFGPQLRCLPFNQASVLIAPLFLWHQSHEPGPWMAPKTTGQLEGDTEKMKASLSRGPQPYVEPINGEGLAVSEDKKRKGEGG